MKHRLGPLQFITVGVITAIWAVGGIMFGTIFIAEYPQYALLAYSSAILCALALGLLHLGWLALFRNPSACWGLIIAKLCAIPITFMAGFMSVALGAMGTDSGMENAAKGSGFIVAFCMAIAAAPTTLAALLGAVIGYFVGRGREKTYAAPPGAPPSPPWQQ
jgi:hypothetical protein